MATSLLPIGTAAAATLRTLYSVSGTDDGASSVAGLLNENGIVYGTTKLGGTFNQGAVFALNTVTGRERVLHSFGGGADGRWPASSLLSFGGLLYGTTILGGARGTGTIFSINASNGAEKVIYSFKGVAGGGTPNGGLINIAGTFYGTTQGGGGRNGTIFSIDPATGTEKVLHSFASSTDGASPLAGLVNVGGKLYGTTRAGGTANRGTVFSYDPATGTENVLHSFVLDRDGAAPIAALIAVGGTLYGTTNTGGMTSNGLTGNKGTVFAIDPTTGAERVLYSFAGGEGADGANPAAELLDVGGTLFGTTQGGGAFGTGAVFSIDPATGTENVLYSLNRNSNGGNPLAELIYAGGELYGTTSDGGRNGLGTVFSVNPVTRAEKDFYAFTGVPAASLNNLLNVNGTLFLSTSAGGAANIGDIVRITPATGAAQEIYEFATVAAGAAPSAPLISVGGTMLYGTTHFGGAYGAGTVFSINPATGAQAVVHSFGAGKDGAYPVAALVDLRGVLYGTTLQGGSLNNYGTVFSIKPTAGNGGNENVLYNFRGYPDSYYPASAIINVGGNLYGTTRQGGTSDIGTIYVFNPVASTERMLYGFKHGGRDGAYPSAPLLYLSGELYGTTVGSGLTKGTIFSFNPAAAADIVLYYLGSSAALTNAGTTLYGAGNGEIFSYNLATSTETDVYGFSGGSEGGSPNSALLNIGGKLYGTTSTGGAYGRGTVFELTP